MNVLINNEVVIRVWACEWSGAVTQWSHEDATGTPIVARGNRNATVGGWQNAEKGTKRSGKSPSPATFSRFSFSLSLDRSGIIRNSNHIKKKRGSRRGKHSGLGFVLVRFWSALGVPCSEPNCCPRSCCCCCCCCPLSRRGRVVGLAAFRIPHSVPGTCSYGTQSRHATQSPHYSRFIQTQFNFWKLNRIAGNSNYY